MSSTVDTTIALTGVLPAVIIVSAVLTALATVVLLWLYKRAVIRGMATSEGSGGMTVAPASGVESADAGRPPLSITIFQAGDGTAPLPEGDDAYGQARRSMLRAGWVYTAGGVIYALVFTTAWMVLAGGEVVATRFIWLFASYCWPIVPALGVVALVSSSNYSKMVAGGYFLILFAIAGVALVRNPGLSPGQLAFFWLYTNGPGTLLLLAFMRRRVRAVGPLVLAFMVAGVTGAAVLIQVVAHSEILMRGVTSIGSTVGLGATPLFVLLHLVGFGIFGFLGWILLRWLGRRYSLKRVNDQSLILDAMWLVFGVAQSIGLAFEGWVWIFTGLAAFALYKFTVTAGFMLIRRRPVNKGSRPSLLLLRVFSLGRRSEALFHILSKLWLRTGTIDMIAGPDLVTATVEPHEFLDFLGNKLRHRFIKDQSGLDERLSTMDRTADLYGRYRAEEFFCHSDTWQMTMGRLTRHTHAVLMDLRSFSPQNQGCLYELETLVKEVPLGQVMLVIDDTTDRAFLEATLHRLWKGLDANSINARLSTPVVQLFALSTRSATQVKALLTTLLGLCRAGQAG